MPENRKILVEVLEGGEIIVSANFGAEGVRHEMRAFAIHDRAVMTGREVENLITYSRYSGLVMWGDGTIPLKPGAQHGPDDIPF